ncbi:TIR domain-containing protein [Bradyrhizobium sp. ERR14]|uniref:TIR domain-containing protein n=1 Tax=Bradyrhizobium sp. ERR14 TaxID=2663837 RepID=UPI0017DFB37F|nr:nucleotide-binding protein [Bradyrhizobium sp. ERR14]MBB4395077.1 putative nucleotide-binding protein [Bradyrhizobium sp. ERR14]
MAVANRHVDLVSAFKEARALVEAAGNLEWVSAASAIARLKPHFKNSARAAQMQICEHAYAKLVRAKARRYMVGEKSHDDSVVPHILWWAKGHAALNQDWMTGSFSTYINDIEHRAFGVSFVREDIDLMIPADAPSDAPQPASDSKKIFLVHGRNEGAKNQVELFLRAIGLEPIILHKRPNAGRHLLTKFREESEGANFAIVLMTPDDMGRVDDEDADFQPRARQNVVFELGFFIGKLGPANVVALMAPEVEKPSDFDGIAYVPYSLGGSWKTELARELHHAKVRFDAAAVLTA